MSVTASVQRSATSGASHDNHDWLRVFFPLSASIDQCTELDRGRNCDFALKIQCVWHATARHRLCGARAHATLPDIILHNLENFFFSVLQQLNLLVGIDQLARDFAHTVQCGAT